jgi:hypothetical protein
MLAGRVGETRLEDRLDLGKRESDGLRAHTPQMLRQGLVAICHPGWMVLRPN